MGWQLGEDTLIVVTIPVGLRSLVALLRVRAVGLEMLGAPTVNPAVTARVTSSRIVSTHCTPR
jgi:hypothetical protein